MAFLLRIITTCVMVFAQLAFFSASSAQAAAYYNIGAFWQSSPPTPLITNPVTDTWTNLNTQTVAGTCGNAVTVNIYVGGSLDSTVACTSGTFTGTVTRASDAAYTLTVQGFNAKPSDVSASVVWTRDTINPGTPTISSPVVNQTLYGNWLTFTGTCDSSGDINLSSYVIQFISSGVVTGTTSCVAGAYSGRMNIFVDGVYNTMSVKAVDRAGNSASVASAITWTRTTPARAWIGAQGAEVTFTTAASSDIPAAGLIGAGLKNPYAMALGAGYVYVSDTGNHRVSKYNATTGAYIGSIGYVEEPCNTTDLPSCTCTTQGPTTAWCTGAVTWAAYYDEGSFSTPSGIIFKNVGGTDYLFVLTYGKVQRINATTGAPAGWIGEVWLAPTSPTGAGSCATKVGGDITPTWCYGGWAKPEDGTGKSGLGSLAAAAYYLAAPPATDYLYVTSYTEGKINRYNISTGAFAGWIGKIGTQPTSPAGATCASAAVGSYTGAWCFGGAPDVETTDAGDAKMGAPAGIAVDASNIYVTDESFHRVNKLTASSGAFVGWHGLVNVTPTGTGAGSATCTDVSYAGLLTPGWCKGGSSQLGYGAGFYNPSGMRVASGYVYVASQSASLLEKFNASTGADKGWMGEVYYAPTGGDVNCATKVAGDFTPGFCQGGYATYGTTAGVYNYFNNPVDLEVDTTNDTIYAVNYGDHRITKHKLSDGTNQGWTGYKGSSPTAWATSSTALSVASDINVPNGDGMFAHGGNALSAAVNDTDGYTYVGDYSGARIQRFNTSTGAPEGWIGKVSITPTGGDAGCTSAVYPNFTPGWCKGGQAYPDGLDGGLSALYGVAYRSGYLYATTYYANHISKYNATTGAFLGSIGKILTSPTGGACDGTQAVGSATPGWCTGGDITANGTDDGMFNYPISSDVSSDGYLYVGDYSNHRIQKFNASTGAFIGWIGNILTSPTGGACDGTQAVGSSAPGWCTGGTSQTAAIDGSFSYPVVSVGHDGNLYVGNYYNYRVDKINPSTGAFLGWVGGISTAPTGGACDGTQTSGFTPGWCTGGVATSLTDNVNGYIGATTGIAAGYNGMFYLSNGYEIAKYNTSTGAFVGWRGLIYSSPTAGDTGCAGKTIGTATPDKAWCIGGAVDNGAGQGMHSNYLQGFTLSDFGVLVVPDVYNERVYKYGQ